MATPTFSVNGNSFYGVTATWEPLVKRANLNGATEYQTMKRHVWEIPQMAMPDYLALQDLQGQILTSLATTAWGDFNNGATYTGAAEISLVSCQHIGQRATAVRVEFRVSTE